MFSNQNTLRRSIYQITQLSLCIIRKLYYHFKSFSTVNPKSKVIKMSKEESSSVIIKTEPCSNCVNYINDNIKVEKHFLDEAKTKLNLQYIKEDIKEIFSMEVKQEQITIKEEIPSSSDTQTDLTDDTVVFTADIKLSPTSFNKPKNISTGEKRFACTFCQYKTSRKHDLKTHIRRHTGEKPANYVKFRCAECEYETPRKRDLVRHMFVHTGERRFACNLCEFKTTQKGTLKRHIMKHTGEKPFACNFCEFKTAQKGNLNNHMMKHTCEKPFACNLCEFKFAHKRSLKIHIIKTHTGEKLFSCNLCEFKTIQNTKLIIHKRIHTGEKPFACNLCEFKTAHKGNLKCHMMKHTNEEPFSCNLCDLIAATYTTNQKDSLKVHNCKK